MITDKIQIKTTTSLVYRVVRRGVRGWRMLTYLRRLLVLLFWRPGLTFPCWWPPGWRSCCRWRRVAWGRWCSRWPCQMGSSPLQTRWSVNGMDSLSVRFTKQHFTVDRHFKCEWGTKEIRNCQKPALLSHILDVHVGVLVDTETRIQQALELQIIIKLKGLTLCL